MLNIKSNILKLRKIALNTFRDRRCGHPWYTIQNCSYIDFKMDIPYLNFNT